MPEIELELNLRLAASDDEGGCTAAPILRAIDAQASEKWSSKGVENRYKGEPMLTVIGTDVDTDTELLPMLAVISQCPVLHLGLSFIQAEDFTPESAFSVVLDALSLPRLTSVWLQPDQPGAFSGIAPFLQRHRLKGVSLSHAAHNPFGLDIPDVLGIPQIFWDALGESNPEEIEFEVSFRLSDPALHGFAGCLRSCKRLRNLAVTTVDDPRVGVDYHSPNVLLGAIAHSNLVEFRWKGYLDGDAAARELSTCPLLERLDLSLEDCESTQQEDREDDGEDGGSDDVPSENGSDGPEEQHPSPSGDDLNDTTNDPNDPNDTDDANDRVDINTPDESSDTRACISILTSLRLPRLKDAEIDCDCFLEKDDALMTFLSAHPSLESTVLFPECTALQIPPAVWHTVCALRRLTSASVHGHKAWKVARRNTQNSERVRAAALRSRRVGRVLYRIRGLQMSGPENGIRIHRLPPELLELIVREASEDPTALVSRQWAALQGHLRAPMTGFVDEDKWLRDLGIRFFEGDLGPDPLFESADEGDYESTGGGDNEE